MNRRELHPTWCAGGHLCGLGEHRAHPIGIDLDTTGTGGTLTRVRDRAGRDHAEIRLRLPLHPTDPIARHQLAHLLTDLHTLLTHMEGAQL